MDEDIEYDGYVVRTTDKAVLFYIADLDEEHWFPKSVVGALDDDETEITVPLWFVKQKGIE